MSTSLKSRIVLAYGYLVALVVLAGAGAALAFHEFSTRTERILAENFESVQAATRMLVALERQDSAVLGLLLAEDRTALLDKSTEDFLAAHRRAEASATLPGEARVVREIERRFESFRASRDRLLEQHPDRPLEDYETQSLPAFESVKDAIFELIDLNHRAMLDSTEETQRSAMRRAALAGILVVVGIVSFGLLSRALRRDLLDRLAELKAMAVAIAGGNRRRRAIALRDDELGVVAEQLNAALDVQQETETRMEGRLSEARQTLRALIAEWPEPVALFTLTGELVATSLTEMDTSLASLAAASPALPGNGASSSEPVVREKEGRRYAFHLIRTAEARRAGWLAMRLPDAGSDAAPAP